MLSLLSACRLLALFQSELINYSSHDLTDILKVKKNYPEGLEAMSKIVKDHRIFILD
ncbi:hypothetical protein [Rickettsia endosymbiont of Pantilius tunicatus]|uniref:hypothetical protein n=1 Tax=Rickettsia endosymbiont of Pantilius tunicatus TaxID=3066267 RepID=UPI00376F0D63